MNNEYLWVLTNDGFVKITDPTEMKFNQCLQELALWVDENPMNITNGIDYKGVREQRVFLTSSIQNITNNYLNYFDTINISNPKTIDSRIICDITFIKDNKVMNASLGMDF